MAPLDSPSDDDLMALGRQAMALPDAPPHWVRRAADIGVPEPELPWQSRVGELAAAANAVAASVARTAVRQIHAALDFDSWASPALATGMRSMPDRTRHLLFSAKGRDIDVRIIPVAERYAMAGQVLGADDFGTVELVHRPVPGSDDGESHVSSLDELGEFRFSGLRQGTVSITLRLGSDEVLLPSIDVGERRV